MKFTHTNHTFEREYPKLVRDRIPEIIRAEGEAGSFRIRI
jgi:predicted house-cleaning noncanonical NTP pyrophosphatase (MazG superfamily)